MDWGIVQTRLDFARREPSSEVVAFGLDQHAEEVVRGLQAVRRRQDAFDRRTLEQVAISADESTALGVLFVESLEPASGERGSGARRCGS